MNCIKVEDLSYRYKDSTNGIEGFSLTINKGDFVAVIGKNGSGKTTFLNVLAGLYKSYKGSISYVSKSGVRLFPYYLLAYIMPPLYKP